jgi:hypothetical protein
VVNAATAFSYDKESLSEICKQTENGDEMIKKSDERQYNSDEQKYLFKRLEIVYL